MFDKRDCHQLIGPNQLPVRVGQLRGERDMTGDAMATPHAEYRALGKTDEVRQGACRALFSTDLDHELLREIRVSAHGANALDSTRFRAEIERALKRRATSRKRNRAPPEC